MPPDPPLPPDSTTGENVFQFAFIDIAFQIVDIFLNLILGFASTFLSGFFNGIFGLFG